MSLFVSDYQPHQCLSLQLEMIAVADDIADLYLTGQFDEQWQNLGKGRFQFGLKGGTLSLKLENCQMNNVVEQPLSSLRLVSASDTEIVWMFIADNHIQTITGTWSRLKLGTIGYKPEDYQITASVIISPAALSVKEIEGLWRHDITPNKQGILERKLAIFLYKHQLDSDLCIVKLTSSPVELGNPPESQDNSEALTELEQSIETIYSAKTDNFAELLELAGLNPLSDLAGGNFLGTQLNGVQLGGANLTQTNFRGADLTDGDLSEANLSYGRLAGADLSGAYLELANLSGADLHRASLALANLIGANLTGANLTEANLSKTNLSGAQVNGTLFRDSIGLSEESKQNLQQRGALF